MDVYTSHGKARGVLDAKMIPRDQYDGILLIREIHPSRCQCQISGCSTYPPPGKYNTIRSSERELDFSIYVSKGMLASLVILYLCGELILQHAAAVLKNIDHMHHKLLSLKEEHIESITISTIPGLVTQVVQAALELMHTYPAHKVQMITVYP